MKENSGTREVNFNICKGILCEGGKLLEAVSERFVIFPIEFKVGNDFCDRCNGTGLEPKYNDLELEK